MDLKGKGTHIFDRYDERLGLVANHARKGPPFAIATLLLSHIFPSFDNVDVLPPISHERPLIIKCSWFAWIIVQ